jgi:hypothetical protein
MIIAVGNSIYQLLAGVSGALIVVIVAIGIALAKTREMVTRALEWIRVHEEWHKQRGDKQ